MAQGDNASAERDPASQTVIAGIDGVEIKVTIRPDQELQGLRSLELNEDTAEVRVIYFYDTPKLDLFNAGIVLRSRLVKGDDDDTTVKVRPIDPTKVTDKWRQAEGFKVEADRTGDKIVSSASMTVIQKRDHIDAVGKGKLPIEEIFNKHQVVFLEQFSPFPIDFNALTPLGPIRVLRWELRHEGFPYELTAEEWRLPNGEDLMEVSIKVDAGDADRAYPAFNEHLQSIGLDPGGAQATKTRTALEYFARSVNAAS